MTVDSELPAQVVAAQERARSAGFTMSCEPGVGWLLAALAAAVPENGRILEIGTGAGVGLAWLHFGLGERRDVELVTVELEPGVQQLARSGDWPENVRFELGDGAQRVRELGSFDLVFPDAPGGKLFGLRHTIAALRPGGVLVVDDMDLAQHTDEELRAALVRVRERLLAHPELVVAELAASSGIAVATRRRAR